MLAIAFKTTRKTVTAAAVLLGLLLCAAVLAGALARRAPADMTRQGRETLPAIGSKAETTEELRAFLAACGWETAEQPEEIIEVLIPVRFDEVMERYNAIQLAQGADLTRYRGRTVQRCTFRITNYPNGEAVIANVFVYNGRIIGGDICSLAIDGFMHGFFR